MKSRREMLTFALGTLALPWVPNFLIDPLSLGDVEAKATEDKRDALEAFETVARFLFDNHAAEDQSLGAVMKGTEAIAAQLFSIVVAVEDPHLQEELVKITRREANKSLHEWLSFRRRGGKTRFGVARKACRAQSRKFDAVACSNVPEYWNDLSARPDDFQRV